MKYVLALVVALCAVSAISADCGCPSCSRGNLQVVPSRSNVDIIYKGQACPCQRALPYQVEIPVEPLPEPAQSYEYSVIAPPRPSPPPQRYIYNYQLQVPVEKPPQQRLNGLLARLDRVVLPAPDCRSVQPALATDSNGELYSNGNDLTPISGGYQSQTVYSNGAINPEYISGSNYDNYNTLSNNFGSSGYASGASSGFVSGYNSYSGVNVYNGDSSLDQDRDSYTLTPCNTVRGPFLEKLGYYQDNDQNDYYRYERETYPDSDYRSGEFIEANGPYVPDSENLDNLSIKNSEYSILEEVPSQRRDYEDYSDEESIGYIREADVSEPDVSDYSSEENDYLAGPYSPVNTDHLGSYQMLVNQQKREGYGDYEEAEAVDNQYTQSTDDLYQLYLEYLGQKGHSRRRRSANDPATSTTENSLKNLFTSYLDNRDCSVPTVNKNLTEDETKTEHPATTESDKNSQIKELSRIFDKYNQIKQTQQNPVSIDKFLSHYPVAAKLLKDPKHHFHQNQVRPDVRPTQVHQRPIQVRQTFEPTEYFKPPQCPTIQNLMRHPKYSPSKIANTGILQFLPELTPANAPENRPPKQSEDDEEVDAIKEHIYNVNGIDIGATRKTRSFQHSPQNVYRNLQVLTYPITTTNPKHIFKNIDETESILDFQNELAPTNRDEDLYQNVPASMSAIRNNVETSRTSHNLYNSNMPQDQTHMLSSEKESEDPTLLYKAIDIKQKMREIQKQSMNEDDQLYQKYLQVPAQQEDKNKYSQYFRVPQFEKLSVDQTVPEIYNPRVAVKDDNLDEIERSHATPMYVEGKICKRHGTFPCRCHLKKYTPNVKFYDQRSKTVCGKRPSYLSDQGFGENFYQTTPKFKRDEESTILNTNPHLVNLVETHQTNFEGAQFEESAETIERFERTIGYILRKLQSQRLMDYIRRKYNERLARKLGSVVRNLETLNTINSVQTGYSGYNDVVSEQRLTNNFIHQNQFINKPKIVYDNLGHKFVEHDGFRRLIKPNIIETEIIQRPCTNAISSITNEISSCGNSNNEVIVEEVVKPQIYKTETIEIIKPEQHYYYPEQKFIIQKTKEVEPIIEEVKIERQPCGEEIIDIKQVSNNNVVEVVNQGCNQQVYQDVINTGYNNQRNDIVIEREEIINNGYNNNNNRNDVIIQREEIINNGYRNNNNRNDVIIQREEVINNGYNNNNNRNDVIIQREEVINNGYRNNNNRNDVIIQREEVINNGYNNNNNRNDVIIQREEVINNGYRNNNNRNDVIIQREEVINNGYNNNNNRNDVIIQREEVINNGYRNNNNRNDVIIQREEVINNGYNNNNNRNDVIIQREEVINNGYNNNRNDVVFQREEVINTGYNNQRNDNVYVRDELVKNGNQRNDDINIYINVPSNTNNERIIEKEIIREVEREPEVIIEEKIIEQPVEVVQEVIREVEPQREVLIKEVITEQEVPQIRENANVEIKEIIKKYQIPYTTCNHHQGCGHGNVIKHIEKEIGVIDNHHQLNQQNQQIVIEQNQQQQHLDYNKLAQLQQYVNLLQLLQKSQRGNGQEVVLNNNIGEVLNQHHHGLQQGSTHIHNAHSSHNLQNSLNSLQNSQNSHIIPVVNTLYTPQISVPVTSQIVSNNLNQHSSQVKHGQSSLENDYSIHKHSQINDIDIEKHQRALNDIYQAKQNDISLNNYYQNPLPVVTNPLVNNIGSHSYNTNSLGSNYHSGAIGSHSYNGGSIGSGYNALNVGYNKQSNFELQRQLNLGHHHGLHGFNKRFVETTPKAAPEDENCKLNPDHSG